MGGRGGGAVRASSEGELGRLDNSSRLNELTAKNIVIASAGDGTRRDGTGRGDVDVDTRANKNPGL